MKRALLLIGTSLVLLAPPSSEAAPACAAFRREQRVEAQKDGQWAKSTVVRCDPRRGYLIHFDGFSSAFDLWLADTAIRVPPEQAAADAKAKEATAAAAAAGYKPNDYVYIQTAPDKDKFVAKLWSAGPTTYSYMSGGVETRIELKDIKGKWDPSHMKYKVGDKLRYVAGGFFPATITSIEAGGYKANITGGYTNVNVLNERDFVEDWTYEEFEAVIAPLRKFRFLPLGALRDLDKVQNSQPTLPKEASEDSVAEFEKIVRAYEAADATIKQRFPKLPPPFKADCSFCPATHADLIARQKELLKKVVPLDPSKVVEEFLRLLKASEESYNKDFRPDDASDTFAAKDGIAHAQKTIATRLKKYVAYGKLLGVTVDPNLPKINLAIETEAAKFRAYLKPVAPLLKSFADEGTTIAPGDKGLESAGRDYLQSNFPKSKCSLLGTEKHDWRPDGTGAEHVGRYKWVVFDCADPEYAFPFALAVAVEQDHLGLGKYGPSHGQWYVYSYYRKAK